MLKLPSLKKWKTACIALASLTLLMGTSPAQAEESQTDGMTLFKEAYLAEPESNRIMDLSIDFFGPEAHLDLDAKMQMLTAKSMCWDGRAIFDFTNPDTKETTSLNVPFYLDMQDNSLTFYTKLGDQWSKLGIQGLPAELVSSGQAVNEESLANLLSLVKSVNIIKETDKLQAMQVKLDASKLTQFIKDFDARQEAASASTPSLSPELLDSLISYVQGQELVVDWIVDRNTHETITTSIDFTPLMRAYAQGALDAMAKGKVTFTQDQIKALESLGYFSELKFYLTTSAPVQGQVLSIPKDVRKAAAQSPFMIDISESLTPPEKK